jgi:hypothetical protein
MYKVKTISNSWKVLSWVVTDQPEGWDNYEQKWPIVAEFKISMRHDNETQSRRAYEYRDYMNKSIIVQPPIGA